MDFTPALNESSNQIANLQNLPDDCHDKESFKGVFGWVQIFQKAMVPFIVRVINGERIKFVSVQMVEKDANIQKYLNFFRPDILRSAIVKFQFMTHTEAKLFNEINIHHYDHHYRKCSPKDYIIRYEDLYEFYEFTKFCYETLYHNIIPNEKYGFIQIDSYPVIPYIIIDGIKYTPLLYFETNGIALQTIKITDWNLSYIKFCRKIQGIVENLSSSDSCDVISIDNIKRHFLTESSFEEFKLDYTKHILPLINNEPANKLFNDHIKQRPGIVPATENTTPNTSTTPVIPLSMSVITNGREMIENQMGLLEKNQAGNSKKNSTLHHRRLPSPPPALPIFNTQRNNRIVAVLDSTLFKIVQGFLKKNLIGNSKKNSTLHHRQLPSPPPALPIFNTPRNSRIVAALELSEIQQDSNAINSIVHIPKLPSPSPSTSTALSRLRTRKSCSINSEIIDLTSPPSSPALSNQQVMLYPINTNMQSKRKFEQILRDTSQNSGIKGLLEKNQAGNSKKNSTLHHRQLPSPPPALPIFNTPRNSRIVAALELSEIQQDSNAINSIVHIPKLPSPSPSTSTALSRLRTRKSCSINSEIIDLTSPPSTPTPNNQSSPILSTQSKIVYYLMELNNEFEERLYGTSRNDAYKIYEAIFYGKKVRCINREPNSDKNLMVNLEYLVRVHFPMCSVERCARILTSQFKITVLIANRNQLALLFTQKKQGFENPATRMIVSLEEIKSVFTQLKLLINMNQ